MPRRRSTLASRAVAYRAGPLPAQAAPGRTSPRPTLTTAPGPTRAVACHARSRLGMPRRTRPGRTPLSLPSPNDVALNPRLAVLRRAYVDPFVERAAVHQRVVAPQVQLVALRAVRHSDVGDDRPVADQGHDGPLAESRKVRRHRAGDQIAGGDARQAEREPAHRFLPNARTAVGGLNPDRRRPCRALPPCGGPSADSRGPHFRRLAAIASVGHAMPAGLVYQFSLILSSTEGLSRPRCRPPRPYR